jgi:hypothetical protein
MDEDFNNFAKKEKRGDQAKIMSPRIKNCYLGHVKIGLYEDQQILIFTEPSFVNDFWAFKVPK